MNWSINTKLLLVDVFQEMEKQVRLSKTSYTVTTIYHVFETNTVFANKHLLLSILVIYGHSTM